MQLLQDPKLIRKNSFSIMILTFILWHFLRKKKGGNKKKSIVEEDAQDNAFILAQLSVGATMKQTSLPHGRHLGEETYKRWCVDA